jgi:AraC family transcriptional regulator
MPHRRRARQSQFHRSQIGRAQRFIRLHLSSPLSLGEVAREAGASSFHFVRLFLAYTGETPFGFLRRVRLMTAVRMLQEDPIGAITEIALAVGYETPSAFNKVFKQKLHLSPSKFRNLGKDEQSELVYRLAKPLASEQENMQLNMNLEHEIVARPSAHFLYLERTGPFAEIAPPAWEELFRLLAAGRIEQARLTEFLGLSGLDRSRQGEESMIYQAGVCVASKPGDVPQGLQYRRLQSGRYAQYLLTGPYSQIWIAFNQIFRALAESKTALRPEYCIENYLNDPKVTPEGELKTQILIPIS